MKEYSTLPRSAELEPHHQMKYCVIRRIPLFLIGKGVRAYWKFIAFWDGTLHVPFLSLLLLCLHPFFGLNALLITGIKPLLCTLV